MAIKINAEGCQPINLCDIIEVKNKHRKGGYNEDY